MPAPRKKAGGNNSSGLIPRHEDCWAKTTQDNRPGINVRDHCINVGCVAEALLQLLPKNIRKLLPIAAATFAALHDIGKVSPGFQGKCPDWIDSNKRWFKPSGGYESSHPRISQIFLETLYEGRFRECAEVVGAHHGRIQGNSPIGDIGGESWELARQALLKELENEFPRLPNDDVTSEAAKWLLAGLIAIADWLGSDEHVFSPEKKDLINKKIRRTKADSVVKRLELGGAKLEGGKAFEDVFSERLKGSPPNPIQKTIIAEARFSPGVYVIEDTMGSGKTEAALWLAYRLISAGRARGLYFGLPTRVTSDRIYRRVQEFLSKVYQGSVEPTLVHGHAWLRNMPFVQRSWDDSQEKEDAEAAALATRQWFSSTRCGLLAPFAVGTVDQSLLGIVAAKWFFVRQFALAGKIVVLDEVHSYDLYTSTLITKLVERLQELGATPVILSATLTAKQRSNLLGELQKPDTHKDDYPSILVKTRKTRVRHLHIEKSSETKQVQVHKLTVPGFDKVHIHPVVEHVVQLAEQGQNVVWIRNTVRHAQEAYRLLNAEKQGNSFEVGLLHSRYPAFQRASYPKADFEELRKRHCHEERWLWMLGKPEAPRVDIRPHGSVLVATQVVEQSVDIDADVLISDLAPTDMLLQRMGRLHRHNRGDRGHTIMYIVVPDAIASHSKSLSAFEIKTSLGSVGRVYMPYVLLRTWDQWHKRSHINLPKELRSVLEDTYSERDHEPESWKDLLRELNEERDHLSVLALRASDVRGQALKPDEEGLLTRFSNQRQITLLLLKLKSSNWEKLQLLNTKILIGEQYKRFDHEVAKLLHLNTATIPSWWLPASIREPLPQFIAQYFHEAVAWAVCDEKNGTQLKLGIKSSAQGPMIYYHPMEGLWLGKPPDKKAQCIEEDGEYEDGMF